MLLVTRTVVVIAAVSLSFVAHWVLPAQTQGPGSSGEAGDNDSFGTTLGQGSLPFEQTLMLSGKVLLDDGTPPGEPVTVYMACGGGREPRGRTSLKGTFTIDLSDRNNLMVGDASVSRPREAGAAANEDPTPFAGADDSLAAPASGLSRFNLFGCRLEAELAGYQSSPVELGNINPRGNPNVGTITMRRREGVAGNAISVTTLSAPKKARKAYEKAFKELRKKKPNGANAERELLKAVAEYPEFAAAWNMLGRIKLTQKDKAGAYEAFEKAVSADASYIAPYSPLLQMAIQDQRWDDAVWLCETMLKLNPFASEARYFLAVARFNKGDMEAAERAVRDLQAGEGVNEHPHSYHLLGAILAKKGEWEPAAAALRSYLEAQPDSPLAATVKEQLAQWEEVGAVQPR
jgi:tetratricopeptide (TPR) repeat protein